MYVCAYTRVYIHKNIQVYTKKYTFIYNKIGSICIERDRNSTAGMRMRVGMHMNMTTPNDKPIKRIRSRELKHCRGWVVHYLTTPTLHL